jgi:AbiV family abortive infection protein
MSSQERLRPPREIEIPIRKISDGLLQVAENIRLFTDDARLLLEHSSDWHAIALAIFAFEELAKYAELKKAKGPTDQGVVRVDERLFGRGRHPHGYKLDIARKLMRGLGQEEAMDLIPPILAKSAASPQLRLNCVFVDWKDGQNGEWAYGTPTVANYRIERAIKAIENTLNWLEATSADSLSQRLAAIESVRRKMQISNKESKEKEKKSDRDSGRGSKSL